MFCYLCAVYFLACSRWPVGGAIVVAVAHPSGLWVVYGFAGCVGHATDREHEIKEHLVHFEA